ncbi:hypothetical protein V8E53_000816 [Lactarius tabidus]
MSFMQSSTSSIFEIRFAIFRHRIIPLIVDALVLQVQLELGNPAMQNIREMAVLSHELLTLVVSKILPGVPDQPLDELIECLRTARKKRPDLLQGNLAFSISLVSRYSFTFVNDDYEEAASILDEILTSGSPEDSKDELAAMAQGFATLFMTGLARVRSRLGAHSTPENLEAMYLSRSSLGSSSVKELDRLSHSDPIVFDLEKTAKRRFHYFGSTGVETLP